MHDKLHNISDFERERQELLSKLRQLAEESRVFFLIHGLDYEDGCEGIRPSELEALGENMLARSEFPDVYEPLTAVPLCGGPCFYDRLIGEPELLDIYHALDLTIRREEERVVARGLDIASGTGIIAGILSQRADFVVATDVVQGFLAETQNYLSEFLEPGRFQVRRMDALVLDFSTDEHFDIASSCGLINFLNYQERVRLYTRVHDLLKPGGRYYEPRFDAHQVTWSKHSPRVEMASIITGIPSLVNAKRLNFQPAIGMPKDYSQLGFDAEFISHPYVSYALGVMKLTKLR